MATSAVSASASVVSNVATVTLKVPGTYANGDGRYIVRGQVFFDSQSPTDMITEISVVDVDNVLGHGANFVVQNFTEKANVPSGNQGWYVPVLAGYIETTAMNYGFLPAQLYLKVVGSKTLGLLGSATMFVNISWSTTG